MSADNGIYILKLPVEGGYEYRVAHEQAIDDIYFDYPDGNPMQVWLKFGLARSFGTDEDAWKHASEMAKDYVILEYGISELALPFPMMHYARKAVRQFAEEMLEIEDGDTNLDPSCHMNHMLLLASELKKLLEFLDIQEQKGKKNGSEEEGPQEA